MPLWRLSVLSDSWGGRRRTAHRRAAPDRDDDAQYLRATGQSADRARTHDPIPRVRGLGSSSAAIGAGILLARQLLDSGPSLLDEATIIRLAAEIEGHPDNVAPCVLGGFTIAWNGGTAGHSGARALRLDDAKGVLPVIFVPVQRGYTAQARAVLPTTVPLTDAAFNAARTALLVRALTGTPSMLFEATEDRLHQGYRAAAMPDTARLVADLREKRIAAVVSGAGPSVLALVPDDQHLVDEAQSRYPDGWYATPLAVAAEGACLVSDEVGAAKPASRRPLPLPLPLLPRASGRPRECAAARAGMGRVRRARSGTGQGHTRTRQ